MASERFESRGEGSSGGRRSEERVPPGSEDRAPRTTEDRRESVGEPDVLLDVPVLNVEELELEVEDLRARISFQAELADMVKINVGIDAEVGTAKIEIQGIEAQALLKARLDNVRAIFGEVLTALERDPELAQNMLRASAPPDGVGAETLRDVAARTGEAAGEAGSMADARRRTGQGVADESEAASGGSTERVGEEGASNLANLQIEENRADDGDRIAAKAQDASGRNVGEALEGEGNDPGSEASAQNEDEGSDGAQATDAARRKAEELGLDLSGIEGTGSGGRILVGDVENAGRDAG